MASKCFMCGRETSGAILCEKCDKPRKKSGEIHKPAAVEAAPAPEPPPAPVAAPVAAAPAPYAEAPIERPPQHSSGSHALDVFPKAPVLPFPVESASPAITSVVNVLLAAGTPAIVVGPDRGVKFVTDEAKRLFDAPQSDLNSLKFIETTAGIRIEDLSNATTAALRMRGRNIIYSLVPLSGGASGAVLVFRTAEEMNESHASFLTFVRETVLTPLRALRESMLAASANRQKDPLLEDSAATIDQVLSSLEMAPEVDELTPAGRLPTVTAVVREVASRFNSFAELKNIQLQVDAADLDEALRDHEQLAESLNILMENSMHYVPPSGQVVIGVRWMEHKSKPLLLFFVMDNGPLVPEELRQSIFEPGFNWQPSSPDRTGRGLYKCREFAVSHGGQVWVESKTGKACTFFLRVRPDHAR